jgi:hypothetical protein
MSTASSSTADLQDLGDGFGFQSTAFGSESLIADPNGRGSHNSMNGVDKSVELPHDDVRQNESKGSVHNGDEKVFVPVLQLEGNMFQPDKPTVVPIPSRSSPPTKRRSSSASRDAAIEADGDGSVQEVGADGKGSRTETNCRSRSIIIQPEKPFRVVWEMIGLIVIIWVTMSLPFKLAFMSEDLNDKDPFFIFQVSFIAL